MWLDFEQCAKFSRPASLSVPLRPCIKSILDAISLVQNSTLSRPYLGLKFVTLKRSGCAWQLAPRVIPHTLRFEFQHSSPRLVSSCHIAWDRISLFSKLHFNRYTIVTHEWRSCFSFICEMIIFKNKSWRYNRLFKNSGKNVLAVSGISS